MHETLQGGKVTKISSFSKLYERNLNMKNMMYVGRRITVRAPSYDSVQFLCDRTMSFKEK